MNVSIMKRGDEALIKKINAMGSLKRRLMDMGVIVGTMIKMEKIAPLGDPMEVVIKGYSLSLRKCEAETIVVEVIK